MAKELYRDQIERFYDLEEAEYSRSDIASLCCVSASMITIWRREPPHPEDFNARPPLVLPLPPMRPSKVDKMVRKSPGWLATQHKPLRAKRPPPRGQEAAVAEKPEREQPILPEIPGSSRSSPPPACPDTPPSGPQFLKPARPSTKPLKTLPEKSPPGGKEEAKAQGARTPVTRGQLDRAVAKEVAAARAEMLKEIRATGFDPSVTWQTEVNHEAFDPVKALVQLAHVPGCPENTILGVLRELVRLRKERAKVAWESVKIEDIPQEHRPRLAGMLIESLEAVELPAEVAEHESVREVFELTGVALPRPAEAEAFLLRWESVLEDMRTDAEARVDQQRAARGLTMDGPPKKAAEFRVKPATGAKSP
ncbi:MAG: hypothetical protein VW516_05705 [Rhodospirillaceae bacterium]|jgi:hypothetical protein